MRKLTKKQKKILDQFKHINGIDKLPYDVWDEIQEINDTEILYQNVDRYLWENYISEWDDKWDILSIVQAPKTWYQKTMNRADIEDLYGDDEPNICFAEGFDEAIAGVVWDGERTRVVYDTELILELLMGRSEMSYEEAVEYFDYNIAGSYMGEYTPLYLET